MRLGRLSSTTSRGAFRRWCPGNGVERVPRRCGTSTGRGRHRARRGSRRILRPRCDGSRLPARPPRLLVSIVLCGLRMHLRFIGRAQHQLGKLPRNFQVLNVGEESKILQIHHGSSNRQGSQQIGNIKVIPVAAFLLAVNHPL